MLGRVLLLTCMASGLIACGSSMPERPASYQHGINSYALNSYSQQEYRPSRTDRYNNNQSNRYNNRSSGTYPSSSYASVSANRKDLPAKLRTLPITVRHALSTSGVSERGMSVYVKNVNSAKPLLAFQENVPRNPASVMKLMTTYAALGILGGDYRWPVEVYTVGNVAGGVLQGDLIFKGYGYPEFSEGDLRRILQVVRSKGIQHINGSLVFDNSAFNIPYQHPGKFDGKPRASYNAQPDALLFNERQGCFVINRGAKGQANVSCPESSNIVIVKNNLRMTNGPCRGRPKMRATPRGGKVEVEFFGEYSTRCPQQRVFNVGMFATTWKIWTTQLGGTIRGGFIQGRTPPSARLIHTYHSKPLRQVIQTVNKKSNNVMARQLLLTISAKQNGIGTIHGGVRAMKTWFAGRGLHFPELRVENGAGLSRHSRVT
jgi:D-alanyl-D-alanine carboxypeptidase/D-alanyl-D-alanine-endopeptidase (penicillin-binding protein 4)